MRQISIVIADGHTIVRQGIRALLESQAGHIVIGDASDTSQALEMVYRLQPDVLILEPSLSGIGGLEVVRRVKQDAPATRVLVLSVYTGEAHMQEMLKAGADGYILKDEDFSLLLQAIQDVLAGHRYLSPSLYGRNAQSYECQSSAEAHNPQTILTKRELEVMQLAVEGLTSAAIAAKLSISPRTAETHRGNLMRKLGVHSQTALIRYAISSGMLSQN